MRKIAGLAATAGAVLGLSAFAAPATAGAEGSLGGSHSGAEHVVFVQSDNIAGNTIVAYDRAENGTLTWEHTYQTGGLGGILSGSAVDHLASQGSLTYDPDNGLL